MYYDFDFLPATRDIVYAGNTSGQYNIWRQSPPLNARSGPSAQLTCFDEWSVRNIFPHPMGTEILAFADKDGDENKQIFAVSASGGWPVPVVYEPSVRHEAGGACYSPNGRFLVYGSNARDPKDMDIVLRERRSGRTRPIYTGGGWNFVGTWAPDSSRVLAIEMVSANEDTNIHLLDIRRNTAVNLTPHKDKAFYFPGPWSPDGAGFYVSSNQGREFMGLGYLPRNGGDIRWLATPMNDVEDVAISPDGRRLAWAVNVDGYSVIHTRDLGSGRSLHRPLHTGGRLSAGWIDNWRLLRFSPDGRRLGFMLGTATRPIEVCVVNLPGSELVRYTEGFLGSIPERELVSPKLIDYPSHDRRTPAWLYKPRVPPNRRCPAVVSIHGGPEAQERTGYATHYQFLLSRGVGILAPNIRGSTGYGISYQRLIRRDWGGKELQDVENAAKYLQSLDWVDPERIGVFGVSFGGFEALSAVTRLPEYWRAAVDLYGPSNLVTMIESDPPHWRRYDKELVGDVETERAFLLERSPITYVDRIRCPLLVIQGANDPRVPKSESDRMVERLKSRGLAVEYVVFPDEGHGFTKRKNELIAWRASVEFLLKHLAG